MWVHVAVASAVVAVKRAVGCVVVPLGNNRLTMLIEQASNVRPAPLKKVQSRATGGVHCRPGAKNARATAREDVPNEEAGARKRQRHRGVRAGPTTGDALRQSHLR